MSKPKILVYDIETTPVLAWIWRLGDQTVRHGQLHKEFNVTKIICITYRWLHHKKSKALVFDIDKQDDSKIIKEFDEIIKEADVVIGKNNKRFDDKHINFRRFMHGLEPMPDWTKKSDDLEKQMRKHFNMQSYSLDYFSDLMGQGGKIKMEFDDWIQIVYNKNKSRLNKMVKYGKKDTDDTAELIKKVWKYVSPQFNYSTFKGKHSCTLCGSENIKRNGTRVAGGVKKQAWYCNDHGGFAGYTTILKSGKDGKMLNS